MATMNAAKGVVKHLFSKLTEKLDHHLEVLKTSISVLLCTLCKIDVLVGKDEMESRVITEAFGMCQVDLQDWVKGPGVIGGSFFGGRIHATVIVYANAELQVITLFVVQFISRSAILLYSSCGRTYCPFKCLHKVEGLLMNGVNVLQE